MLQKLYIKNYAIIDELEISFHPYFTVLTGETGAGKSIILGALSLILGERADTSVLIDKEHKCIIEAVFDTKDNEAVATFLKEGAFDTDIVTSIRREISASGKSRSFINDTPANLSQLQELGSQLVDLNRQFDNRLLNQTDYQYGIIDSFSDNLQLIRSYGKELEAYQELVARLQVLKEQQDKASAESEYLQFLSDELEQANFVENEIELLEEKVRVAQHQEDIARVLSATVYTLSEADDNQIGQLRKVVQDLQSIIAYHPASGSILNRLHSVLEELKDIAAEVDGMNGSLSFDQAALDQWTERMDIGFRLLKKHHAADTNELIAFRKDLESRLAGLGSLEADIAQLELEISAAAQQLNQVSRQLTENRKQVIPVIVSSLEATLAKIGMGNAQIKITLEEAQEFNRYGKDEIAFLIDANKSGHFAPIAKVASGGEMSRLLLAVKSLVSGNLALPTLIFDEVDAAISGEAAKQVAVLMQTLAARHQVIVLTHQAQMAARGHLHLFIYKEQSPASGIIQTRVKVLDPGERVGKIAQMIGGLEPGQAAVRSAEELLGAIN